MARKPMVTRTISTTKVSVMCLNITTGEPSTEVFTLPRVFTEEKKIIKAVQENLADDMKAVHVTASEVVETLYGMTEQEFINNAKVLDPETRKMLEADEEN